MNPFSMQVSLRLSKWGIHLDVWLGDDSCDTFILSPSFGADLESISSAIRNLSLGSDRAGFCLWSGPQTSQWTIERHPGNSELLEVSIQLWAEMGPGSGSEPLDECKSSFTVDRDYFVASFIAEFDKIGTQLNFPGFCELIGESRDEYPWEVWKEIRRGSPGTLSTIRGGEQGGVGQPATRSESDPEGGAIHQPESDGHPR